MCNVRCGRAQVLYDMDDSMVALLPAELATEATTLRRDLEDRHRRILQQRYFHQGAGGGGAGSLSALLRHSGSTHFFLLRHATSLACLGDSHAKR